jgi:hypothetical protein
MMASMPRSTQDALQRCLQACQCRGQQPPRRRDRAGGRRPRRQELDLAASVRPHLQGLRAAGVLSVHGAGVPRSGTARVGDAAGPMAAAGARRAVAGADRQGDRCAAARAGPLWFALRAGPRCAGRHRIAARDPGGQGALARGAAYGGRAHAHVLLGLSAQHLDPCAPSPGRRFPTNGCSSTPPGRWS